MRRYAVPLAFLSCVSFAFSQAKIGNDQEITPSRLRSHLEFIASDELEGRDTPSRGLDVATLYVATQLKLWGAVPAGDNGTFFQNIKLAKGGIDMAKSSVEFGGKQFAMGDGFRSATGGANVTGKLVYVGHGYTIKSKGIDPYAGLDVKGKILVVASGFPNGVSFRDMQGTSGVDFATPQTSAQKLGALAVLTIRNSGATFGGRGGGGRFAPVGDSAGNASITNVVAGPALADAIFAGEPVTASQAGSPDEAPDKPFEFASGKLITLNMVDGTEVANTRNVVAIVPGSDPKLKDEFVAYGAHIDHLGMRATGAGDRIYNGADDDGSGTVSILEIAHAYLTGKRPKRSSLFVWHIGEEKGLWGSEYFVNHPTVNIKNIVAQLNIDMIGRSYTGPTPAPAGNVLTGPSEVYVVGSTKMSTDLQKTSESVNEKFLNLKFNYKYDDPKDTERIFFRSDHYNYAHKGIPIIFYFDGVHPDYHQVSDEVDKIDFDKMSRIARTVYATGWTLANAKGRPVVDKPLKE